MGLAIIVPGASFTGSSLGKVTFDKITPVTSISIGEGETAGKNKVKYSATVLPVNATDKRVRWAVVEGSDYAVISDDGIVSARPGANSSPVVIRATAVSAPTVYAEKTIRVTASYDYYYYRQALSGTATDFDLTDIKLFSDENTQWTLFLHVPILTVPNGPGSANIRCVFSCSYQGGAPYEGISVETLAQGRYDAHGKFIANLSPVVTQFLGDDGPMDVVPPAVSTGYSVAFSRDGQVLYYSFNGVKWAPFVTNIGSTSRLGSVAMAVGGTQLPGGAGRFPTSDTPAQVALLLGKVKDSCAELFTQFEA